MSRITVGELRRIIEELPDEMPVVIDSQNEQSCAYYVESASVQEVAEPLPDDEDDVPGDVGYPAWIGNPDQHSQVLWVSQWGWRTSK